MFLFKAFQMHNKFILYLIVQYITYQHNIKFNEVLMPLQKVRLIDLLNNLGSIFLISKHLVHIKLFVTLTSPTLISANVQKTYLTCSKCNGIKLCILVTFYISGQDLYALKSIFICADFTQIDRRIMKLSLSIFIYRNVIASY